MGRKPSVLLAAIAVAFVTAAPLAAQMTRGEAPLTAKGAVTIGPVGSINFPTGDGSDDINTGFTAGGQATYGMGAFALIGEVTFNTFGSDLEVNGETLEANGMAFDAGGRYSLNLGKKLGLYVGGVTGLWTGDFDSDFDIVPLAGIQLGPVDIEARYKGLLGDAKWFSAGAAIHFKLK